MVSFPPNLLQGLADASLDELAEVELSPHGTSLHWEKLDADFNVPGLIAGVFGTRAWMADLGRKGRRTTSEAKAAAARANGRKGGRPRKIEPKLAFPARRRGKQPLQENNDPTISMFEMKLVASPDFRPVHFTRVLDAVSRLPIRAVNKVSRLLEEDAELLILSLDQEVIEGQMMPHPIPVVLKEGFTRKDERKFSEPEPLDFGLAG